GWARHGSCRTTTGWMRRRSGRCTPRECASFRGRRTARASGGACATSAATASSPISRRKRSNGATRFDAKLCGTHSQSYREGRTMKTWEYKIINVRSENYSMDPRRAEELNRLGDEGWELVSITSINFKTG